MHTNPDRKDDRMAVSERTAAVGTYAQQLLDNQDVHTSARQAVDATRTAYRRARGQDPRKAVQDRKLRRRVTDAVTAAGTFLGAVSETPPKPKSPWPRRIALLAIVGFGAWLISNQAVRARVQGFVGQDAAQDQTEAVTVDGPDVPLVVVEPDGLDDGSPDAK
jgi:hypothetical protein